MPLSNIVYILCSITNKLLKLVSSLALSSIKIILTCYCPFNISLKSLYRLTFVDRDLCFKSIQYFYTKCNSFYNLEDSSGPAKSLKISIGLENVEKVIWCDFLCDLNVILSFEVVRPLLGHSQC